MKTTLPHRLCVWILALSGSALVGPAVGCSPNLDAERTAATSASVIVGQGVTATTTTGSATTLAPGQTLHLSTTVTATANLGGVSVAFAVFDPVTAQVGGKSVPIVLTTGQSYTLSWDFVVPANARVGSYRVDTAVHNNNPWTTLLDAPSSFVFQVQAGGAGIAGACAGTTFFCDDFSSASLASSYATRNGSWTRSAGSYTGTDPVAWERTRSTIGANVGDFDLTMQGRSGGDYGFGVVYAASASADDGYAVIVHPAQFQGIYLKKLVPGQGDVAIANAPLAAGLAAQTLTLRVKRQAAQVTVWLGGQQVMSAGDGGAGATGRLGLIVSATNQPAGGAGTFTLFRVDSATGGTSSPSSPPPPPPSSPSSGIALGMFVDDDQFGGNAPWNPAVIDNFIANVGKPAVWHWYEPFSTGFTAANFAAVDSRGMMPMLSWAPSDTSGTGIGNGAVTSGGVDTLIHAFAHAAASWGKPFYLRLGWEMNLDATFAWGTGMNGNSAASFVAMWKHVHDIFVQDGASNVRWFWCPSEINAGDATLPSYYPGDAYVDVVGFDAYNWGTTQYWSSWRSLVQTYQPTYDAIAAMTSKPMVIGETGSVEQGGDKAAWFTQGFLTDLPAHFPRIKGVVYFDENAPPDWRVGTSSTALAAFKNVVASPVYAGKLP